MDSRRPQNKGILILDYGSQYTLLIARKLRELGIYAEIIDGSAEGPPVDFEASGLILSGGPDSVSAEGARTLPGWVIDRGLPILGICYGLHLLASHFKGRVSWGNKREYGSEAVTINPDVTGPACELLSDLPSQQTVWMSHGDSLEVLPEGFSNYAVSQTGVSAIICHHEKPIFGLQFHPEVHHSPYGKELLQNFALQVCGQERNWDQGDRLAAISASVREQVGDGRVFMAVSGGVDSTVASTLLVRALGPDQVVSVFVDHGLLRKNEADHVEAIFRELGHKHFHRLEHSEDFFRKLSGVDDPEEKRKIIGRTFIEVFESFAKDLDGITHLGQGTLYPDVIESAGHGAGSKVIKSHHNVGGLPEHLSYELIEPFRFLFKDEVRELGRQLGIRDSFIDRHPFPGPGLAVRILGAIEPTKVKILQEADDIFIKALVEHDLYQSSWQAFAVLLPIKTVGVMGDNRTYEWTLALRSVDAVDGMTASASALPMDFLMSVADKIVRNVSGINRVVYDLTSKPPATIEWE